MEVLGLDPSLQNFGIVQADLDLESHEFKPYKLTLVETKPSKDKKVRKNSDDLDRLRAIWGHLGPLLNKAELVFVEIPVGSQSARAMASYGFCLGLLAAIDLPLIHVTPTEVKMAACGKKTASKDEMIGWATKSHPGLNWLPGKGGYGKKNEHLADAIGSIHAGLQTDDYKSVIRMLNLLRRSA